MNTASQANDAQPTPASPEESLEEATQRTHEVMTDARTEVDRARRTLHDQLMPTAQAGDEWAYADQPADQGNSDNDDDSDRSDRRSDRDTDWLGKAIALARDNVETGGWPFGAVIVLDGAVVATGVNEVLAKGDPTAHAEVMAIRGACSVLNDISLSGAVLYASCEPCPMCLAAMRWAGLTEIVYGAERDAAARAGFQDEELYDLFTQPRDTWPMAVRQQSHNLAEDPLSEWQRRHQTD